MIAFAASGLAAGTLVSCSPSCGRPKVPSMEPYKTSEPISPLTPEPPVASPKRESQTLFEKNAHRTECQDNPAICDGDYFQMDIKKELKTEFDTKTGLSSTLCAGGCSDKSAIKWSLQW